jgi:hypothetical protein
MIRSGNTVVRAIAVWAMMGSVTLMGAGAPNDKREGNAKIAGRDDLEWK